jgi:hypothetical protein
MGQAIVRNLDDSVLAALKRKAKGSRMECARSPVDPVGARSELKLEVWL